MDNDKREIPRTFDMTTDEYEMNDADYIGFCISCGADKDCVEPDARNYECDECGKHTVFGTSMLLVMGRINITD